MSRISATLLPIAMAACASTQHVDAPQTTSATVQAAQASTARAVSPPDGHNDPTMPFDLPKLPPPDTLNTPPDDDLATRSAAQRDRDITAAIRKSVLDDPNLSPDAKAVEVTVEDRKVTLRGRVKTEQERMDIDGKARAAAGVVEVDDRIELVP